MVLWVQLWVNSHLLVLVSLTENICIPQRNCLERRTFSFMPTDSFRNYPSQVILFFKEEKKVKKKNPEVIF